MRIISGKNKGHIIRPPKGLPIRPTTDRSKESLFNILENRYYLPESSCLDLFSGGGTISLEFCSREVQSLLSIDIHPKCVSFLKSESDKLGFDQIQILKMDVMVYLKNYKEQFDIIFCDAPYAWKQYDAMVRLVIDNGFIAKDGVFILEHHSVTKMDHFPELTEQRAYGQNILSFFKNLEDISAEEDKEEAIEEGESDD